MAIDPSRLTQEELQIVDATITAAVNAGGMYSDWEAAYAKAAERIETRRRLVGFAYASVLCPHCNERFVVEQ